MWHPPRWLPVTPGREQIDLTSVSRILDDAFSGPAAMPDYLRHECERAERALLTLAGGQVDAPDTLLKRLFARRAGEPAEP